jgi:pimeloyl-ACP methyl ester carboxylesterase
MTVGYKRSGSGAPVLLIQGVGAVGRAWTPQVTGLSQDFSLITPDNRGIGKTPPGSDKLTIESMAQDAIDIMDSLNIERFHVVGHSMGGIIAQQVALTVPHRIKSLSLLCTFYKGSQAARLSWDILIAGMRTRIGSRAMRRKAFIELIMPQAVLRTADIPKLNAQLEDLFERDLADQPPIVMKQLRATAKYDASARLGTLRSIATLIVSGAEDRIALPEFGQQLHDAIPGSRLVVLPDAGHAVPIHSPEVVNELLREHMVRAENG